MQTESISLKAYELLKFLIAVLRSFPKEQRFQLGDRMQNLCSEVMELLLEAYYLPPGDKKRDRLAAVNVKLECLRFYVRLCYELGFYTSTKYGEIAKMIDELGRMTGGWLKSLK